MNNNLLQILNKKLDREKNEEKKLYFMEETSFLMAADDVDYRNYYFSKELTESEFSSLVDLLYHLENLQMLGDLIKRHKRILGSRLEETDFSGELQNIDDSTLKERLRVILQIN